MTLPSPLLAVTDRLGHARPVGETVRAVLAGGGRWIWFRDRDLSERERRRVCETVAAEVRAAGGVLTVGGDIDLAAALEAGGVHLRGGATADDIALARDRLGAQALIGVSAHTVSEVEALAHTDADYVTLSPIFPTASKPGYGPALGLEGLRTASGRGLPVVALGGMGAEAASACRDAGAMGFAVMGAIMRAEDPAAVVRRLLTAWSGMRPEA